MPTVAAILVCSQVLASPTAAPTAAPLPWPPPGAGPPVALRVDERTEALAELVDVLAEHARWCGSKKLFGERARLCRLILELDADHGPARKTLGFRRGNRGTWKPPEKVKTHADRDASRLPEARARLATAVRPATERLIALLERPDTSAEQRSTLEEYVLRVDPENPRVRAARGEVAAEGRWVLKETADALERRRALDALVQRVAAEGAAPDVVEPSAKEAGLGLGFEAVATASARVLATSGRGEADAVAQLLDVSLGVWEATLGQDPYLPEGCTIYLLSADEKQAFLDGHAALSAEARHTLSQLDGSGVPGTADWVYWTEDEEQRAAGILRLAIDWYGIESFGLSAQQGWALEGLGLYFGDALLGRPVSWYAKHARAADEEEGFARRERLTSGNVDWLVEAHGVLTSDAAPALADVLAKAAGELTLEELCCAAALAAFLMEAHRDDAPVVLRKVQDGASAAAALEAALGLAPEALQARLQRWVGERAALPDDAPPAIDQARLARAWQRLSDKERRAVAASLRTLLAASEDPRLSSLRRVVDAAREASGRLPAAPEAPHFDPKEHAPHEPTRRKRLDDDDRRLSRMRRVLLGKPAARALRSTWRYDWGSGAIQRTGDPDDPEVVFANANAGYHPDLDLARAFVLQALDGGHERKALAAFGHAYTDRDGNVYPGLTLYDAWRSGETIEMPDVDTLGIVHDVLDEWTRWKAPVPGSEHGALYGRIQELFQDAHRYRTLREALALCLFIPDPVVPEGYESLVGNLHALWAAHDSDPATLAAHLPDARGWEGYLDEWVRRCKSDGPVWDAGRWQRRELSQAAEAVRRALSRAMQANGAVER